MASCVPAFLLLAGCREQRDAQVSTASSQYLSTEIDAAEELQAREESGERESGDAKREHPVTLD